MTFVWRMVGRELRASWRRLVFFFVCVAIGVGAIAAMRSVIQNIRTELTREARSLLAADVVIQTNRPWEADARTFIEAELSAAGVARRASVVETTTMVRPTDEAKAVARMVELQAVSAAFPLYGQITLEDGRPYTPALLKDRGVLVRPELLAQLNVDVGERLEIGQATFEIRGVIRTEPGRRLGLFSIGPRVLMALDDLDGTKLLAFGSRASYRDMLVVGDARVQGLVTRLRDHFKSQFVSVRWFRSTEDQIGEDLARTENYLSLVGFVMVVLGGIGVWSVTRVFVQQKLKAVAVLKCLGATSRQAVAVYVAQMLVLAAAGSLLGVALGAAALRAVPSDMLGGLAANARHLTLSGAAQAVAVGIVVSLLFAAIPLRQIVTVKPLLLLRDDAALAEVALLGLEGPARWTWRDRLGHWRRFVPTLAVAVGLVVLAAWQAGSLRVGVIVCLGFMAVVLVLYAASVGLVRAVRPLASSRWFALRHAVLGFARPGNQTRVVLLSVGLGTFFLVGIRLIEANLMNELEITLQKDGPDMFLLDVQEDQQDGVQAFVAEQGVGPLKLLPVLRARVTGVEGREINLESYEDVRGRGSLAREYTITYRGALEANERVIEGRFWDSTPSDTLEVSIEESLRDRFRLHVGDRMRFDILGRIVEAGVTSVRRVEWADSRAGGFMFVFRPGVLEQAPHAYIGLLKAPDEPRRRAALQRDLVARFSNVSAIDIREVARTVQSVVGSVTLAIAIVGAVALASGVLILIGSVAMTKVQRMYEAALFKTLGASTRVVAAMMLFEYTTLGLLAGLVGAASGSVLGWALSDRVLEIRWQLQPLLVASSVLATGILVGAVGVLASLDVLRRRPLSILRAG